MADKPAVVIVSGGLDSTTLAYWVRANITSHVHGLGFNYGQRHAKELTFAQRLVDRGILDSYRIVDLTNIHPLVAASSLTNLSVAVPDGHYAEETMKATVVPNRNMIMLSIAVGYAVTIQAESGVWYGVHGGDHFIYPDCRPEFVKQLNFAAIAGNEGFIRWINEAVNAPFSKIGKHDIVHEGTGLGVPFVETWSCYKGGDIHCGRCGTCVERKEAFRLAQVVDPTEYVDPGFEIEAYR